MSRPPRIAVRGVIVKNDRLLLVNAYPGRTDLWCAPGGGVQSHASLPDNLAREVLEETGLRIYVDGPCLVNEFHDAARDYHQIDIYFRCTVDDAAMPPDWTDPEGVVTHRRWVTRGDIAAMQVKPDSLATVAWGDAQGVAYDPLEPIIR